MIFKTFQFFFIFLFAASCTNLNHTGKLNNSDFLEEITFDEQLGLAIIEVNIDGEDFRFLFDTGAPNAISHELQSKFNFSKVGNQGMRDSQGERNSVYYVKIDELKIGNISFGKMNAFVTDFSSNPTIKCLNIDGIIGSPLMRHCIWQVNFTNQSILFTDQIEQLSYYSDEAAEDYETDNQFSIVLKFEMEEATAKNLKLDYGSVNAITFSEAGFEKLEEVNALDKETLVSRGFSQSGLFGKVADSRTFHNRVSGILAGAKLQNVAIVSGKKSGGLLGTEILQDFIVTMNFPEKKIHFHQIDSLHMRDQSLGFIIGRGDEITFVLSVKESSPASLVGMMPGDTLQAIDDFQLVSPTDFCTYVLREKSPPRDSVRISIIKSGIKQQLVLKRK